MQKIKNNIFPIASKYPKFFQTNLLDPSRIIKQIKGKGCGVRAFYYQLLKLIFQLDVMKDGIEIDYSHMLLDLFSRTVQKSQNNQHLPYLRQQLDVVTQFITSVSQSEEAEFEQIIQKDTKVDIAFNTLFEEVLKDGYLENGSVQQIIGYLCQIFDLKVSQIEKCIKFQQSDVFVYIQNQNDLYLAFLSLEQPNAQNQNSIDKVMTHKQYEAEDKNNKKVGLKTQNDTIINIFSDMLHSSKYDENSKVSNSFLTNNLNNSLSPGKKEQDMILANAKNSIKSSNKNNKQIESLAHLETKKQMEQYIKTSDDSNFIKNQSQVQKYHLNKKNKDNQAPRQQSPEDTIYRPKNMMPTLQTISQVTASKQSLLYSRKNKKDPLDFADEDEKGTFYRQFTNTRILNILPEPQRSNVKMLKNRFVGVHSRNLKKI